MHMYIYLSHGQEKVRLFNGRNTYIWGTLKKIRPVIIRHACTHPHPHSTPTHPATHTRSAHTPAQQPTPTPTQNIIMICSNVYAHIPQCPCLWGLSPPPVISSPSPAAHPTLSRRRGSVYMTQQIHATMHCCKITQIY